MSEDTAVKTKKFLGKDEDWIYWAPLFLARADAKGYRSLIEGSDTVPPDADSTTDQSLLRARRLNKMGYSELLALCSDAKVAFLHVKKARSTELPNGDLKLAWKNLTDRYKPKGIKTVEEVIEAYMNCKLESNEDPDEWITRKDKLCMKLQVDYGKKDYEDDDFKASILFGLPEEYQSQKTFPEG